MRKIGIFVLVIFALFSMPRLIQAQEECRIEQISNNGHLEVALEGPCDTSTFSITWNGVTLLNALPVSEPRIQSTSEAQCNLVTVINSPEDDALNLRPDHNKSQSPLGQVFNGTQLWITSLTTTDGDGFEFYPITLEGWVSDRWLDNGVVFDAPAGNPLLLRAEASRSSALLGELYNNTLVEYLDDSPTASDGHNWRLISVSAWVATIGPNNEQLLESACIG